MGLPLRIDGDALAEEEGAARQGRESGVFLRKFRLPEEARAVSRLAQGLLDDLGHQALMGLKWGLNEVELGFKWG